MPCVIMMVVTSLYTVIDGFFVSNYAGKMAFAAVNLIWPFLQLISAAGFMFGSGGSALTAFVLGTGDEKKANEIFTMLMAVLAVIGVVISVVGFIFMRQIAVILGADEYLIDDCVLYGRILICANPLFYDAECLSEFSGTAERPRFGLGIAIMAGLINGILDFLLVAVFPLGVWGRPCHCSQSDCRRTDSYDFIYEGKIKAACVLKRSWIFQRCGRHVETVPQR